MNEHNNLYEPWLGWAKELQFLAQCGLAYSQNKFDIERFERIREISSEMISYKSGISKEKVKDLFCSETGFQTPKIDTRAAIFKDGKILLVQENNGKWSLPGGWCDACESVKSNTEKEAREEAGVDVEAERIIAIQDRKRHNLPVYAYDIIKIFVLCRLIGGEFKKNTETLASGFFDEDNLPTLAEEKNNPEQIKMCFEFFKNSSMITLFD
ncbi:MAG TPA: NUDIX hydrolase [Candidatus Adamsella sp.]|nr:NUDIX hydrolase [Candidatus Adamsella sp.]